MTTSQTLTDTTILIRSRTFLSVAVSTVRIIVNKIRYDTVALHELKSWRDGQLNLARSTETKKIRKNCKQKPSSSEETVWAIVREGSPGGRSETTGLGFVKQVGGWTEWWIKRGRSDGWPALVLDSQNGVVQMRCTYVIAACPELLLLLLHLPSWVSTLSSHL